VIKDKKAILIVGISILFVKYVHNEIVPIGGAGARLAVTGRFIVTNGGTTI
jgi:hypothetical protein